MKHSENGKITDQEKVYMKDVYVGGMPQFAGTFGVRYFVNYWVLGANVNGFARNISRLHRCAACRPTMLPSIPTIRNRWRLTVH